MIESITDGTALPREREDYRILFENNPLPMWVFDTDSLQFLMVNASAVKLYGYSKEEFLQMTIKDIRPQEDISTLLQVTASSREPLNYAGEWVHLKKDGTQLYVEVVSHALQEDDGVKRLVVVHDITARKLAEKQLAEAERHAQTILANIVEIIFSFNDKMEMTYVSPQCYSILGYTPQQFYEDKLLWFNLVHPEDRYLFEEALPKIRTSQEQFQMEYRIKTASNDEKWFITRCTGQLNKNGYMTRMDGSAIDITHRKVMEEKLRFADFSIERASEAFLWSRPDGSLVRVNRAACVMLGFREEELLGLRMYEIAPSFGQQDWAKQWASLEELHSLTVETEVKDAAGELHPVEMQLNYFNFEQKSYSFTSIRQIVERKQAEAEKAALTEEMARQNEHLRQFAYIVSHNLRAPVANIVGLTNLYNRKSSADPINSVLISKLERTSQRLDTTIRDLNEILSIRSKTEQVLEKIDLQQVFADIKESLSGQFIQYTGRIHADFLEGKEVMGVKGYVHSIFLNLITNAIKYQDEARDLEIHINTVFSNGYLCLQVQDNGLGIDLVKQGGKIFGLYRRFHPHIDGKGLGLYMIKTQAETMGGWVDVESEVGKGSIFKVYFQIPPYND
ncbi:PAS domain-containing sensor histidine kinase [Rufibacter immobilis]|uniref:histidine kinase n=1 Tax=Rufibacter immobilis TaxID=1348778 RepID=A0A3M9MPK7_9BACT|nr:PAS domain S-box protein [Rufibacter immobilis]RNI27135.1 PAS domain-containing sensor histidine kinase [Rufibacter immobilis]